MSNSAVPLPKSASIFNGSFFENKAGSNTMLPAFFMSVGKGKPQMINRHNTYGGLDRYRQSGALAMATSAHVPCRIVRFLLTMQE